MAFKDVLNKIAGKNDIGIVIYDNGEISNCSSLTLCSKDNLPTYITKYFPQVQENGSFSDIIKYELINVNEVEDDAIEHELIY